MLRARYVVPEQYSVAAEQFMNDPWVRCAVKLASQFSSAEPYSILMGNHRAHYDFPHEFFTNGTAQLTEATPDSVIIYDTDNT